MSPPACSTPPSRSAARSGLPCSAPSPGRPSRTASGPRSRTRRRPPRRTGRPVPKPGTAPPASIYNHALTVGFSRAFDVAAGIGLLALLIGIVTIRVSRQELAGAEPAPQQPAPQPTALQAPAAQPTALQPPAPQPTATAAPGTAVHGTAVHGTAAHGTAVHGTAANSTAAPGTAARGTSARDRAAARGPSRPRRGRPSLSVLLADPGPREILGLAIATLVNARGAHRRRHLPAPGQAAQ